LHTPETATLAFRVQERASTTAGSRAGINRSVNTQ
jgi:hypothetical protein